MHFVNRDVFTEAPTEKLDAFSTSKKEVWADYNSARINKIKPLPSRPPSLWLHDDIRKPLKKLFLKNCGYCGIHTDEGRDAEVDHFFPTSMDEAADHVFEWTNYVWSCPSCNGMKNNNFPFLNPCSKDEMAYIYFHHPDGKYLLFNEAPVTIVEKYNLTLDCSNINLKNRPERRKCLSRSVVRLLKEIDISSFMFTTECSILGKDSEDAHKKKNDLDDKKELLLDLIRSGDYLFLIEQLVNGFSMKNRTFPYAFNSLLSESKYLDDN